VISNQKLQSRPVFALSRNSLRPTDLHESGDIHGDVGEREHAAYNRVFWQRLVNQYADTTPPDILGYTIEQEFRFLQNINAREQTDTQLDGVGKARRFSGVYDFSLVKHGYSLKWKMIA